jgi:hypothetical protein
MEQIAILGVVVFGFIALFHAFNTVRSLRRAAKHRPANRPRRPVYSKDSARAMAQGLVREVAAKKERLVEQARESGVVPAELEAALEESRAYFRERVEPRLRPVFNAAVDEVILGREPAGSSADEPKGESSEETS